jgi:hypothetical protein
MEDRSTGSSARLEVDLARADVISGENIDAQLSLQNEGTQPLWANGRMLVNSPHAPKPYREITLSVVDHQGVQLNFQCKVRAGQASSDDYSVLGSGQSLSVPVRLNECFDLSREGTYLVVATYEDGTENVPTPPEGTRLLRGPIRSAEKKLRVLSAK